MPVPLSQPMRPSPIDRPTLSSAQRRTAAITEEMYISVARVAGHNLSETGTGSIQDESCLSPRKTHLKPAAELPALPGEHREEADSPLAAADYLQVDHVSKTAHSGCVGSAKFGKAAKKQETQRN